MNATEAKREVKINLDQVHHANERLQSASTATEQRLAWEGFANYFCISVGKMIKLAKEQHRSKDWGEDLKRRSTQTDEGLVFIRETRNAIQHDVGQVASATGSYVTAFGGFIRIDTEPDHIPFQVVHKGKVVLETKPGGLASPPAKVAFPVNVVSGELVLQPVYSDQKKRWFQVPSSINGKKFPSHEPRVVACTALEVLREIYVEFCREADKW